MKRQDYKQILCQTTFADVTAQSFTSQWKACKSLLAMLVKRDIGHLYYELFAGLSWRIGIFYFKVQEKLTR